MKPEGKEREKKQRSHWTLEGLELVSGGNGEILGILNKSMT